MEWIWIDTCCIDKASSAELSEAINSMFAWYRDAQVCIVYLADVPTLGDPDPRAPDSPFRRSRWFTRGWTLQELVAPDPHMVFLSREWVPIGRRAKLADVIEEITKVDAKLLTTQYTPAALEELETSVARRMSWAASRQTTRAEDRAYSLMGLFDIHMPILYGEGGAKAFTRLQMEIIRRSPDHTIFAWGPHALLPGPMRNLASASPGGDVHSFPLLARSPTAFRDSGDLHAVSTDALTARFNLPPIAFPEYHETNHGVRIQLPIFMLPWSHYMPLFCAVLACYRRGAGSDDPDACADTELIGLVLRKMTSDTAYARTEAQLYMHGAANMGYTTKLHTLVLRESCDIEDVHASVQDIYIQL
ncbi:hypothetical protein BD413DRAFT_545420 [Trametes elegans]|nr:hypothetical protein BD413DRAFT_545420 [Trametes elegans]